MASAEEQIAPWHSHCGIIVQNCNHIERTRQ